MKTNWQIINWNHKLRVRWPESVYWDCNYHILGLTKSLPLSCRHCLWQSVIHFVVPVSALGSSKWSALHWFQTKGCNRQAYENQLLCLGLNCCGLLANCCAGACFLTSRLMIAHGNTHNTTTDTPHNSTRRWLTIAQRLGLQRRSARPTTNNYSPSSNSSLAISQTFHSIFLLNFSWNLIFNFSFGRILQTCTYPLAFPWGQAQSDKSNGRISKI